MSGCTAGPLTARDIRKVVFVPEQAVDHQNSALFDALLDRLVTAKCMLLERKGKWLFGLGGPGFDCGSLYDLLGQLVLMSRSNPSQKSTLALFRAVFDLRHLCARALPGNLCEYLGNQQDAYS